MSKIRVYELAKQLEKESSDILAVLEKIGITGKKPASGIEEDDAQKVKEFFNPAPKVEEKKVEEKQPEVKKQEEKKVEYKSQK